LIEKHALCSEGSEATSSCEFAMADKGGKDEGQLTARPRDSRADRLRSALRENLKRRKMQARERGKGGDAPSTDGKPSLHEDGDPDV
jgi:hypothetical protein